MIQQNPSPNRLFYYILFFVLVSIIGIKGIFILLILYAVFYFILKGNPIQKIIEKIQWMKNKGIDISAFQTQKTKTRSPSSFFQSLSTSMENFEFKPKFIIVGIIFLLGFFVIVDGFVSVPAGQVGVLYDRGRGVLESEIPEGLHFKIPFWQVATVMDTRLQTYTMSYIADEGEMLGDDSIEAMTSDGQKVDIDVTVQFRIDPKMAAEIYQSVGLDYEEKVIRPEVRSVIREVITGFESKQLFALETRQKASLLMEEKLRTKYAKNNILLESLLLRNVRFSDVYLSAIEEKQIAEQRIQKAEFEKQEAEIQALTIAIQARGEADALREKGKALQEFPEIIQLEFINKLSPAIQWGILPDGVMPLLNLPAIQ